jgi:hypothetical protein
MCRLVGNSHEIYGAKLSHILVLAYEDNHFSNSILMSNHNTPTAEKGYYMSVINLSVITLFVACDDIVQIFSVIVFDPP